ncbi:MAG: NADH-quinone oxidoreductase subunit A [Acidimicrobiales bacterium]|nr:NADH-quinone oxidoreductase subunit A [Acidimicrobiales bacterium]
MTSQYLPVIALLVLSVLFAAISFGASRLLAPRSPNDRKQAPYECGIIPAAEDPNERFPVRFYLVAMIFIVFDIEIIFFYPWALSHRSLGLFGLVAVGIFALAVFESFIYLIGKGALEWGPNKQIKPKDQVVSLVRDTSNTIRRVGVRKVGQEGRNLNDQSFGNQEVSN